MKGYSLSSLGTFNNEILEYKKRAKYNDLEDMVYRFQQTYHEIIEISDLKCIPPTSIGYTVAPGIHELTDIDMMLNSLLPTEVKTNIAIDDIRLKSNITTDKTIKFTKKHLFYIIFGF